MKFYDCATAPSPRRARMFIAEKGLDIETVEVDLRNGEQMGPDFRQVNPYCTVPVLELDDGTRLLSTAGIRAYLEAAHPEPALLGRTDAEKGVVADLVWRVEVDGFSAVGEALRNVAKGMKDRALTGPVNYAQIPDLGERGKARAGHFLATARRHDRRQALSRGRCPVGGGSRCLHHDRVRQMAQAGAASERCQRATLVQNNGRKAQRQIIGQSSRPSHGPAARRRSLTRAHCRPCRSRAYRSSNLQHLLVALAKLMRSTIISNKNRIKMNDINEIHWEY